MRCRGDDGLNVRIRRHRIGQHLAHLVARRAASLRVYRQVDHVDRFASRSALHDRDAVDDRVHERMCMPAYDRVDALRDMLRQIDDLPRASRLSRAITERSGMRDDNDDFGTIGTELPR